MLHPASYPALSEICEAPDGPEGFLLCRSEDRRKKDPATLERFSARIVESLESLARRLEQARKQANRVQVGRQIGRLLERNRRAAGKFRIHIHEDDTRPSGLRVEWSEQRQWSTWAQRTEGTYLLRSNVPD